MGSKTAEVGGRIPFAHNGSVEAPSIGCAVDLPPAFRTADILAFHRRDPLAVAERVDGEALHKGLAWAGRAACLSIRFVGRRAEAELAIDGAASAGSRPALEHMLRHMLGLAQHIEDFEERYRGHPQLGPLIAARPGLRVATLATPFEALTWAITGQQISVRAAIALRRRLIQVAGLRHSGGLACYPGPQQLAGLGEHELVSAGFSHAKARTLMTIACEVGENRLPLDDWMATRPVEEIRERLATLRGVGPWTIDYTLLRGFGWLDGSLHGDAGVRRGLQILLGLAERVGEAEAKRWLAEFSPWRALVAAHLWALRPAIP